MNVKEKDFGLYVEGVETTPSEETPEETKVETPEEEVTSEETVEEGAAADQQTEEIADLAADAGENTEETPPAEENPTEETPEEKPEETKGDETPGDDVSGDNLQQMLDAITEGDEKTTKEIKEAAEDVKESISKTDTESQNKIDELLGKVAELEANQARDKKTIEVLKTEYEKTLGDKIGLEYGTASDSKIAKLVNEDADIKNLIAAKLGTGDESQDKIKEAWRAGYEAATGTTIDSLISAKKDAETDAMSAVSEGASAEVAEKGESLYL